MKIRRTIKSLCMTSFVLLNSLGVAQATSAVANMQANATLNPTCSMSATDVHFTGYVPSGTPGNYNWGVVATGTLTINLSCTTGTSPVLSLNGGNTHNAMTPSMQGTGSNTDLLAYRVKTGVRIFGDGSGTTTTVTIPSPATGTYNYPVILPLNQYVTPDSYSDTLTLTATY